MEYSRFTENTIKTLSLKVKVDFLQTCCKYEIKVVESWESQRELKIYSKIYYIIVLHSKEISSNGSNQKSIQDVSA